jgi:hypothetical protein
LKSDLKTTGEGTSENERVPDGRPSSAIRAAAIVKPGDALSDT